MYFVSSFSPALNLFLEIHRFGPQRQPGSFKLREKQPAALGRDAKMRTWLEGRAGRAQLISGLINNTQLINPYTSSSGKLDSARAASFFQEPYR